MPADTKSPLHYSNAFTSTPRPVDEDARTWKPLGFLNIYRLILSSVFAVLLIAREQPLFVGTLYPTLAFSTMSVYLLFSVLCAVLIYRRWPRFVVQTYLQIIVDILAITILMYASGGAASGVGMLLVVAIASGSIILPGTTAYFFAALAAMATLAEEVFAYAVHSFAPSYMQAGFLGATFFATAMLAYVLARRARESEELATQRGIDLANLTQLNEHVIQRMQSGIVVVDADFRVRLMNESAWHMLGMPAVHNRALIHDIAPGLGQQLTQWRENLAWEPKAFRPGLSTSNLVPRFTRLGAPPSPGTLIFLEDASVMAQQAQQMKLASLGRLTASIAHEIRNPLGAISHAGQLLSESPQLDIADKRLTEIIQKQSRRVNTIIENVLQLSRRERSNPQTLDLKPWLESFVQEFTNIQRIDPRDITVDINPPDTQVLIDPTQLQQVLTNLCENALRHCSTAETSPKVDLHGGVMRESGGPFLDVQDHGSGISPENAEHIFEPFFTTESTGSGLGLYIARELCEINRARLNYIPVKHGGACFRINFASAIRSGQ